jgi:hypothetical protein
MSWDPLTWLASITSLKWSGNADGGSYVGAAPVSEKFRTVQSVAPPPNELFPELQYSATWGVPETAPALCSKLGPSFQYAGP